MPQLAACGTLVNYENRRCVCPAQHGFLRVHVFNAVGRKGRKGGRERKCCVRCSLEQKIDQKRCPPSNPRELSACSHRGYRPEPYAVHTPFYAGTTTVPGCVVFCLDPATPFFVPGTCGLLLIGRHENTRVFLGLTT